MRQSNDPQRKSRKVRKNFRLPDELASWLSKQGNQTRIVIEAIEMYRDANKEDQHVV